MASHAIALLLRVSAANYAAAARQFRDGNLIANPLALALFGEAAYVLATCTAERITLIDVPSGRRYSGPVPPYWGNISRDSGAASGLSNFGSSGWR